MKLLKNLTNQYPENSLVDRDLSQQKASMNLDDQWRLSVAIHPRVSGRKSTRSDLILEKHLSAENLWIPFLVIRSMIGELGYLYLPDLEKYEEPFPQQVEYIRCLMTHLLYEPLEIGTESRTSRWATEEMKDDVRLMILHLEFFVNRQFSSGRKILPPRVIKSLCQELARWEKISLKFEIQ